MTAPPCQGAALRDLLRQLGSTSQGQALLTKATPSRAHASRAQANTGARRAPTRRIRRQCPAEAPPPPAEADNRDIEELLRALGEAPPAGQRAKRKAKQRATQLASLSEQLTSAQSTMESGSEAGLGVKLAVKLTMDMGEEAAAVECELREDGEEEEDISLELQMNWLVNSVRVMDAEEVDAEDDDDECEWLSDASADPCEPSAVAASSAGTGGAAASSSSDAAPACLAAAGAVAALEAPATGVGGSPEETSPSLQQGVEDLDCVEEAPASGCSGGPGVQLPPLRLGAEDLDCVEEAGSNWRRSRSLSEGARPRLPTTSRARSSSRGPEGAPEALQLWPDTPEHSPAPVARHTRAHARGTCRVAEQLALDAQTTPHVEPQALGTQATPHVWVPVPLPMLAPVQSFLARGSAIAHRLPAAAVPPTSSAPLQAR